MLRSLALLALHCSTLAYGNEQQSLLALSEDDGKQELIDRLTNAAIIPDVIDLFAPQVRVGLTWLNASAGYGNSIDPDELQDEPAVALQYWPDEDQDAAKKKLHQPDYIVVLTDPDAPSNKDPKWSQVCHWIAAGVHLSGRDPGVPSRKQREIIEYKPPGPPPKTGPHRYVAVALSPINGTTKKLHLTEPSGRHRWGYKDERAGVREWAEENGLQVIGANFIYAQNHKQ